MRSKIIKGILTRYYKHKFSNHLRNFYIHNLTKIYFIFDWKLTPTPDGITDGTCYADIDMTKTSLKF